MAAQPLRDGAADRPAAHPEGLEARRRDLALREVGREHGALPRPVRQRMLRPQRYRFVVTAVSGRERTAARRIGFRVVKG